LTNTQTFDGITFKAALDKTVEKRSTSKQMADGITDTIVRILGNQTMADLWQRYQKKYFYAAGISWSMVISALNALAEIVKC